MTHTTECQIASKPIGIFVPKPNPQKTSKTPKIEWGNKIGTPSPKHLILDQISNLTLNKQNDPSIPPAQNKPHTHLRSQLTQPYTSLDFA